MAPRDDDIQKFFALQLLRQLGGDRGSSRGRRGSSAIGTPPGPPPEPGDDQTASVSATAAAVTSAVTGLLTVTTNTGTIAATIAPVSSSAGALQVTVNTGTIAATITAVTSAATGASTAAVNTGTIAATVPTVTASSVGTSGSESQLIFNWPKNGNGVTKTNWDSYLDNLPLTYPVGAPTRPAGRNSTKLLMTNGDRMFCQQSNECATMLSDGTMVMERYSDAGEKHVLVNAFGQGDNWDDWYLRPNRCYQFEFSYELIDDTISLADYKNNAVVEWLLMFEMWAPMNWAGWTGGGQVPVQLIIDQDGGVGDNKLLMRLRGSTDASPTTYEVQNTFEVATLSLGVHSVIIAIQPYYLGGYCRVWHDSVPVVDETQSIGLNQIGNTTLGAMVPSFGCYSSAVSGQKVHFTNGFKIYDFT